MKKKLTAFFMILCMLAVLLPQQPMPVMAATTTDGNYEYTVNEDSVTITKYKGSGTQATVPDTIEGKPVTSIGDSVFEDCSELTSIRIPEKVTSIGNWAFWNCGKLTSIRIPDTVTSIGEGTFSSCSKLTSITIPDTVTSIGEGAFGSCYNLKSIHIPDTVTSIGNEAFSSCSGLTSITIPDTVTSIGDSTFINCISLTSITIPDTVTSIGSNAFNNCVKLTSITIPEKVTSIGDGTFCYCIGLTSITIPGSVTSIGDNVFEYCDQLKMIYYTGTEEGWNNISGKFPAGISKRYPVTPPEIKSKPYTGSPQKAEVTDNEYYTVTKNEGGTNPGSYDVELTLKEPAKYAWTTAVTSVSITLKFEITQVSGGSSSTGGGSSTGSDSSYTPVTPPVNPQPEQKQPVTETKTILVKDEKGNDVPVELTTTTHPDGTVTDAKAKLTRNGSRKKNQLTGLLSGVLIANIEKEAKTEDIELTVKIKSGKKTYEVTAGSKDLTAGVKLKVLAVDQKTGELMLVNGMTYQADKAANVKLTLPAGQNYRIMIVKEAKAIEKKIAKSIRLKKKSVTLKKGKKYQIRLDSSVNMENIKSITYSSEDTSVATVSKSGKVTAKGKGNVTIKVKVTLKNGITKTLTVQINVE